MEFVRFLRNEDPDIITGYNIFGFDNVYLRDRAARHDLKREFSIWSRINSEFRFREKRLASSALETIVCSIMSMRALGGYRLTSDSSR